MQERREEKEERKRREYEELRREEERERKEKEENEQQKRREEKLEKEREERMMQMFQHQTQIFFTHQSTVKEQEQQFLKAQQIEVRNTQQELMDQQRRASTFQSVLSRLPKLSEKSKVASFFHQLEKTLVDHEIPARKWLQALQSSLDGSLVDIYWDTFRQEERDTYETSECTLMKWCAFSITECIQQVGVVRMKYSETTGSI